MERALAAYAGLLARRAEVRSAYLCGSWAKGTYTAGSDVDLVIIIDDDCPAAGLSPRERVPSYLPDSFPTGLDLFVYSESEAATSAFAQSLLKGSRPLIAPRR